MLSLDGRAWLLYAFDLGRAIALARCRALLTTHEVVGPRRPEWPHLFGLDERPLVVPRAPATAEIGGRSVEIQVRLILYDFGNVSVALSCPLAQASSAELISALGRTPALDALARAQLDAFVAEAGQTISEPKPVVGPSRFVVVQTDAVAGEPREFQAAHASEIARYLRDEPGALSRLEIDEVLTRSIGYGPGDLVVVDTLRALVVDDEWEDTLAVLDFANCERLTLEALDEALDDAIEAAGELGRSRASRLRLLLDPWGRALARLMRLTLTVTTEFESVENAIKLTGDDYLARVYRLTVERLNLRPFQDGITRKLSSLWSIQQVFLEQAATRRGELLEWMIILLIVLELVRTFR